MSGPAASTRPTVRPYGDRGLLLEVGTTAEVVAWSAAVRRAAIPGVLDVVPAAVTVLLVLADPAGMRRVRTHLDGVLATGVDPATSAPSGAEVEIPVVYDGPDLDDVARHTGLSVDEVVAAHTGRPWTAAFGGFAPGFAYLVGGDDRLAVPRRDSARSRVPAGSVALAGAMSAVYPSESPGGWQLVGRTTAPMWDLDRDPAALVAPGDTVRFVAADR